MKKIVGSDNFSAQFIKIISHYNIKTIGYNINIATDCMLGGQPSYGWQLFFLLNCTPVCRSSDSITVPI